MGKVVWGRGPAGQKKSGKSSMGKELWQNSTWKVLWGK